MNRAGRRARSCFISTMMQRVPHSRAGRLAIALSATAALACSGGERSPTDPAAAPVSSKAQIFIAADSFVITTPNNGRPPLYRIGISADDTTRVRDLTATTGGFVAGDPGTWLTAQLDRTTAPAVLLVRVDPAAASPGPHPGTITISATGADPRVLHLALVVLAP